MRTLSMRAVIPGRLKGELRCAIAHL